MDVKRYEPGSPAAISLGRCSWRVVAMRFSIFDRDLMKTVTL